MKTNYRTNVRLGERGELLMMSVRYLILFTSIAVFLISPVGAASRGISLEPITKKPNLDLSIGTYRALIIGNNKYKDPKNRWPSLKTAVNDATAVAKILRDNYGFADVKLLENATRRQVLQAINVLSSNVGPNDSVLLYYAGHGYLDSETERGYWVPTDAVGSDNSTFLRNSTIRDELNVIASRARHTLLISDSCFSGSLLSKSSRSVSPGVGDDKYYKKVASKKSVQIISAGGLEFVDDDYRSSGHSPFTYFLLNELKYNDRTYLTAAELSRSVETAVSNNVDQKPQSGVLQGAGDELGEFIFIKVKVVVDAQGIPKDKIKVDVSVVQDKESGAKKPAPRKPKKRPIILPVPTL
ncbi:MAG: caspase domain-containing protein [Acidiferrobacterales bacterium]